MKLNTDVAKEVVLKGIEQYIHIETVFRENMRRINKLFKAYSVLFLLLETGKSKVLDQYEDAYADTLRAIVVFTHSSVETLLREIMRLRMKEQASTSPDILKDIPLIGTSSYNRSPKFSLKDLHNYRNKSVLQVVNESIDEHVSRKSFNSEDEIVASLKNVRIPEERFQTKLPLLAQMIKRRHRIVHEADHANSVEGVDLTPISVDEIKLWAVTTRDFYFDLIVSIATTKESLRNMNEILRDDFPEIDAQIDSALVENVLQDQFEQWKADDES